MQVTAPVLSYLQNPEKILPTLLIEVPTTLGRTYQGYKRGGVSEGRERILEESLGAVVWLFGIKTLNKVGDFVGTKLLGLKDLGVDVGKDSLRNPAAYIQDKKNVTALFKFSKILSSVVLGTMAMGMAVPKIKMAMTNAFRMQEGLEPHPQKNSPDGKFHMTWADKLVSKFIKYDKDKVGKKVKDDSVDERSIDNLTGSIFPSMPEFLNSVNDKKSPSFTGLNFANGLMYASHNLENNNAWRLLSTDVGTLTGRVANSRNKKEGIEYFVRDSISSLFYIFAAPLFSSGVRKAFKLPDVHPKGALSTGKYLKALVRNEGNSVANDFFSSSFLNEQQKTDLIKNIQFSKDKTITLADFNRQTGGIFASKAGFMSELQPQLMVNGQPTSILSQKQVIDIMSSSKTSDPLFLKKAISEATNGKSDDVKSFISRGRLEKVRDSFDSLVLDLEKYAKKKSADGKITEDIIDKYVKGLNRKNLAAHMAGYAFAVLGLAVLIPKFQYWVSEKLTGESEFPGAIEDKKQ